ncbi:sigmaK-factor processing regulatory BofA [Methanobacterium sp. CWC-01]|jgi:inhibitor of the pro-sigma K processing machinery|uniref:pro-sigmaK processing inhibitor BofA family protein n=1 Tax=Methanobacterium aridiramus TaxID=2584467 RepID=UPI0025756F9E|nr:pro-sigmaK processing inhibitor BofA family protein [Methanobacterium sp. CWC-01]WJI09644.1 sigmaK-factor processing regulatory BofA [Methanobacterium sp. CWC-01]
MGILEIVLIGIILVILGIIGINVLLKVGKIVLTIVVHMLLGWIMLFIWNILPFFKIPITILTVLVAGFGGILGVGVLILAKALGLY